MLKFWKKKPAETPSEPSATPSPAETPAPDSSNPALHEALAEVAPAAEQPTGTEPLPVAPAITGDAGTTTFDEPPAKRSWRDRLSGNAFSRGLTSLFVRHPKLDDDLLDELETTLITADVGGEPAQTHA
jgi:fused signal recognition particle receptor